jgi:hypothetical protein
VSLPHAGGYTVEAVVQASDLGLSQWSLASGGRVGFDVAVDVGTAPTRAGQCNYAQFLLRLSSDTTGACAGRPFCDTRAFCTPTLAP